MVVCIENVIVFSSRLIQWLDVMVVWLCALQCHIEKRDYRTGVQWLDQANSVPVSSQDVSLSSLFTQLLLVSVVHFSLLIFCRIQLLLPSFFFVKPLSEVGSVSGQLVINVMM